MADQKNEPGRTPSSQNSAGTESGAGARISAGTSVGNAGESPMPHAQTGGNPGQSATLASHTSTPLGGDRARSQDRTSQESNMKDRSQQASEKTRQAADEARERIRHTADQARQRAGEAYEAASDWAEDAYDRASHWASEHAPRGERYQHMRDRSRRTFGRARNGIQEYVAENPMVVGIVGLAAGLLLGALLPRTRSENEMFGEWADEVRNQGLRYARDATQRGREYLDDSFSGEEERFSRHESEFRHDRPDSTAH